MNFKKAIAAGAVTVLMCNSVLGVSAANTTPGAYAEALIKSGKGALILDVDAYKAAYSDLYAAFGDDTNAYIEHYLTQGILEGRTIGALFNPLAYAEAYGDIKTAYGDDILSIVDHYVNYGIAENRTIGTANGFADLATAQAALGLGIPAADNAAGIVALPENVPASSAPVSVTDDGSVTSAPASANVSVPVRDNAPASNDMPVVNDVPTVMSPVDNTPVSAPATDSAPASAPVVDTASAPSTGNTQNYHHTTSIYENDNVTLIRVEYYDDNNKLIEYSSVTNFDSSTNSYTENIYTWDAENETSVLLRTDTYVDGTLSSSENP